MNTNTRRGFLVLADIAGFTPFIAETELEHSQAILNEIIIQLIKNLTPSFRLAEVEGDALFLYADEESFARKEKILELVESAYYSFRDKKSVYQRITTCRCRACEMIPTLDLKFIIHYGDYILNKIAGQEKPLGNAVNAAHRLLKNKVTETTGWKAYVLSTKDFMNAAALQTDGFRRETEKYDHIGDIEIYFTDLDKQYNDYIKERRFFLSAENADLCIQKEFPLAPPELWEWFNVPKQRSMWMQGSDWAPIERPNGRTFKGASNHCVNSKVFERVIDYRPYNYYTSNLSRGKINATVTAKFEQTPSGTKLDYLVKLNSFFPGWISRLLSRFIFINLLTTPRNLEKLGSLIAKSK